VVFQVRTESVVFDIDTEAPPTAIVVF